MSKRRKRVAETKKISKTWLITLLMYAVAFSVSAVIVTIEQQDIKKVDFVIAGNTTANSPTRLKDNVNGFAWSSAFGWISFNSTDCDTDGNGVFDGTPSGCPAAGTPFFDYGVNINSNGEFIRADGSHSYAWSNNLGWIDFSPESGYPTTPNTPTRYASTTDMVTGWAKALSLGNDGWIKFSASGAASTSIQNGEFHGWGWNGNDNGAGIGWLSFNCEVDDCGVSSYKVTTNLNTPPTVSDNDTAGYYYGKVCIAGNDISQAWLKWNFNDSDYGATQSAYQIIFNNVNSTSNPLFDTGKCTAYNGGPCWINENAVSYPVHNQVSLASDTTYYWWVKVWDDKDEESALVPGGNFTTYKHNFPAVTFDRTVERPSKDQVVRFTDTSTVFGGASKSSWLWTASNATNTAPTASSTDIIFNESGSQQVSLKVTDSDSYYCVSTSTIPVNIKLPKWIETKSE